MPEVIQGLDVSILTWLRAIHNPLAVWSAWIVATLAWKGIFFWALAGFFWLRGQKLVAAQLALALIIGTIEIGALKGLVLRPRPDLYTSQQLNIPMPELLSTTHSFPSGHTTLAAAAAFILAMRYSGLVSWAGWIFVALVGIARVFQGMHWPTDVLGSVVLGAVAGFLALKICQVGFIGRLIGQTTSTAPRGPIREPVKEKVKL